MFFDIIVLAVLLISALHAFWRGFIREVLTIFGSIGGALASVAYGDDVRPFMDDMLGIQAGETADKLWNIIPMTLVSGILAYGIVFIVIFGVLSVISHLIAEQVRAVGLGAIDRTLGVLFGLVRGLLITGLFYLPVHMAMNDAQTEKWFGTSRTHYVVQMTSKMIQSAIPDDLFSFLEKDSEKGKKQSNETGDSVQGDGSVIQELKSGTEKELNKKGTMEPDKDGYLGMDREMMDKLIELGGAAAANGQLPTDIDPQKVRQAIDALAAPASDHP